MLDCLKPGAYFQARNPGKLAEVSRHQFKPTASGVSSDEEVVGANWLSEPLKLCANVRCVFCSRHVKAENFQPVK